MTATVIPLYGRQAGEPVIMYPPKRRKKPPLVPHPKYPVSEVKLVYTHVANMQERPQITRSQDVYDLAMELWDMNQIDLVEEAMVIYATTDNRVLSFCRHSKGGKKATSMETSHILLGAMQQNAASMFVLHNHPSHNMKASRADELCAQEIYEAAKLFKINMLDMMIVGRHDYLSFADRGMKPF